MYIKFDYSNALKFIKNAEIKNLKDYVTVAHRNLHEKKAIGKEFLGWLNHPTNYDKKEFEKIKKVSEKNKKRLRYFSCNRYRRIISRSESSYRNDK